MNDASDALRKKGHACSEVMSDFWRIAHASRNEAKQVLGSLKQDLALPDIQEFKAGNLKQNVPYEKIEKAESLEYDDYYTALHIMDDCDRLMRTKGYKMPEQPSEPPEQSH